MSDKKNNTYFYKLEPAQLLSALIQIPESERGAWITKVAVELATGNPLDPFSKNLFDEAQRFKQEASERNRLAGIKSAEKRKQQALDKAQQMSTNVEQVSTGVERMLNGCQQMVNEPQPNSSSSSSSSSNTEAKKKSFSSSSSLEVLPAERKTKMTTNDIRFLHYEFFGSNMPGGCGSIATEISQGFSDTEIREAFQRACEQGKTTMAYVRGILLKNGEVKSRDRPQLKTIEQIKAENTRQAICEWVGESDHDRPGQEAICNDDGGTRGGIQAGRGQSNAINLLPISQRSEP